MKKHKQVEEMNAFEAVDVAIKAVKHLINNFPLSMSDQLDAKKALAELNFVQHSLETDLLIVQGLRSLEENQKILEDMKALEDKQQTKEQNGN